MDHLTSEGVGGGGWVIKNIYILQAHLYKKTFSPSFARKTVRFSEQIMSRDKIPEHISSPNGGYCLYIFALMEVIVYLIIALFGTIFNKSMSKIYLNKTCAVRRFGCSKAD